MFKTKKYQVLFNAEDPTNAAGAAVIAPPAPPAPPVAPTPEAIIKQYNSDPTLIAMKHADVLADNFNYRERERQRIDELETLRTQKVELEEAVKAYEALGKPDELQTQLEAAKSASEKLQALEREKAINDVAAANGLKPSLLKLLAKDAEFISESAEVDGETKTITKIKVGDDATPIKDYFTAQGQDVWDSLQATPSSEPTDKINYPAQPVGGKSEAPNPVNDFLKRNAEEAAKGNPLMPAKAGV